MIGSRAVTTDQRPIEFDDLVPQPVFGPFYEAALSFSADASEVAFVAGTTERYAIWRQPVSVGQAVRVTDGDGWFVHTACWSPDGRWIAYNAANSGDEALQVFLVDPEGGRRIQVTDAPQAIHRLGRACWSPDATQLAYSANDRRPGEVDLLVYDVERGRARRLLSGGSIYHAGSWSPDGRRLLAIEERPLAEGSLLLVDVETGAVERLTEPERGVTFIPGPWMRDGDRVLVLTNLGGEFIGLATLDLRTRRVEWIHAPSWDVERVVQSADGSTAAWTVNEAGYSRLYLRSPAGSGRVTAVRGLPDGVVHGLALSHDGRRVAVVTSGAERPYELVALDVARRRPRKLVGQLMGGLDAGQLVQAESVEYETFDGLRVHGFLMRPRDHAGRCGVVVALHGGPHNQERPNYGWSGLYQYLASRGVAVFTPNIRGSSGYGASFERLLVRRYGCDDVLDVEHANSFLRSLPWVDPERIGLLGFCYGGFVALAAVARSTERWRATACWGPACDLLDLVTGGVPEEYDVRVAVIGDPVRDREELIERSPLTHADRIRTPLFILHGRQDIHVPRRQSDKLAALVRANGVPVDYREQEGHGFADMESILRACRETSAFLVEHLVTRG